MTFPLIMTADGRKMGKTEKGAVWLDPQRTSPYDYYQFWINTDDRDVKRFLALFTFLSMEEIEESGKAGRGGFTERRKRFLPLRRQRSSTAKKRPRRPGMPPGLSFRARRGQIGGCSIPTTIAVQRGI